MYDGFAASFLGLLLLFPCIQIRFLTPKDNTDMHLMVI